MTLSWVEPSGRTRLRGDVLTDGGATGDVLTQQADGSFAPAAASGGSIVSAVLYRNANVDIHTAGAYPLVWDALYDNLSAFTPLVAIPAGLGVTFAFDNTSADIVTTVSGVWAFTYNLYLATDSAWIGTFGEGLNTVQVPNIADSSNPTICGVFAVPSGVTLTPTLNTTNGATANPLNVTFSLSLVRLG